MKRSNRREFVAAASLAMIGAPGLLESSTGQQADPKINGSKQSFEQFVTEELEQLEYLTGEAIQQQLVSIQDRLKSLSDNLAACESAVGDLNDVGSVRSTLAELKKLHGIP